jgi:hypothetical protein
MLFDPNAALIAAPAPNTGYVLVTGYIDGSCSITDDTCGAAQRGVVTYLGGHECSVRVPISTNADSQSVRLFLASLFAAPINGIETEPTHGAGERVERAAHLSRRRPR